MINDMPPPLPWPTSGDSILNLGFARQNSLDIWGLGPPPGMSRMDSNGSEFNLNFSNIGMKSQISTGIERDQPHP